VKVHVCGPAVLVWHIFSTDSITVGDGTVHLIHCLSCELYGTGFMPQQNQEVDFFSKTSRPRGPPSLLFSGYRGLFQRL